MTRLRRWLRQQPAEFHLEALLVAAVCAGVWALTAIVWVLL